METSSGKITCHPQLLNLLFACKQKAKQTFDDVLGVHEIDHVSLTYINNSQQILTLSSTPALEYNLFSSSLWKFDNTYNPEWYKHCRQLSWQSLYDPNRYDDLYYSKQLQHNYPTGTSIAASIADEYIIYSLASHKDCEYTRALFANEQQTFYKIGQYCTPSLLPLMTDCDNMVEAIINTQASHEISE